VAFVASKAKAAKLTQTLSERGVDKANLDRLPAPAGLDIQARSQEEIAVSILAEIVQLGRIHETEREETAEAPDIPKESRDPICGMTVDIAKAKHQSEFEGRFFLFCGAGCKQTFDKHPEKYSLVNFAV
jgi:xanthine dehydrogenase accessory factor